MADLKFRKKGFKTVFMIFAATMAAAGIGYAVMKKFGDAGDKATRKLRNTVVGLNERQKKIINLFAEQDRLTNREIERIITGVTRRTLRRDLTELAESGLIKQHGKTKGSYYTLSLPQSNKRLSSSA
ncbi:MAG TPA: DUF977 family protein [bacterium]|nr:DUF977 family protein [bacterium]